MTKKLRRRVFIETSVKGMAAASLLTAASCSRTDTREFGQRFVHHVFFWLKMPVTQEVRDKFEKALKDLVTIETISEYHLGIPASTSREVIDSSYTYSLLTTFRDKVGQDIYQEHPTHLQFIEGCKDLWERVVVYDSISI
jgi:hypothetical protein